MATRKISIRLDLSLIEELERLAEQQRKTRSRILEERLKRGLRL